MINVYLNEPGFEYDIHSLVKAFYPERDVKVSVNADTFSALKDRSPEYNNEISEIFINWGEGKLIITVPMGDSEECPVPDGLQRIDKKNLVKQSLYRLLSRTSGKKLPWGALTGIRPTKLAMDKLSEGTSGEEAVKYMMDMYFASREKAELCVDIAKREKSIIESVPYGDGYSLYVGIPFCPTTCMYCSFTSYNIASFGDRVKEYLDSLFLELSQGAELFKGKKLYSVYIGGGTPTSLTPEYSDLLLSKIEELYDLSNVREYTVEAGRPDSITTEKLKVLKAHNISRISVNPQTMNQKTLDAIGRRHTVEDTVRAFNMARDEGFDNINMDLILGLPGEGMEEICTTMEEIRHLSPDSLTIHSLAVKRASKLAGYIAEHGREGLNNSESMMDVASKTAYDMGLKPYYLYRQKNMTGNLENVGFASEGKYGLYNILMMEEIHSILACGAGTISKQVYPDGRIERSENIKDLKLYIEKKDEMLGRKSRLFADC